MNRAVLRLRGRMNSFSTIDFPLFRGDGIYHPDSIFYIGERKG